MVDTGELRRRLFSRSGGGRDDDKADESGRDGLEKRDHAFVEVRAVCWPGIYLVVPLAVSGSKEGRNTKLSTFHLWQKNTLRHCEARCHRDSRKRQNCGHPAHGLAGGPSSLPSFGMWGNPWAYRGEAVTKPPGHHQRAIVINTRQPPFPDPPTTTTTTTPGTISIRTTQYLHSRISFAIATHLPWLLSARRNGRRHPCCPAAGRHHHLEMRDQGRPTPERKAHHSLLV